MEDTWKWPHIIGRITCHSKFFIYSRSSIHEGHCNMCGMIMLGIRVAQSTQNTLENSLTWRDYHTYVNELMKVLVYSLLCNVFCEQKPSTAEPHYSGLFWIGGKRPCPWGFPCNEVFQIQWSATKVMFPVCRQLACRACTAFPGLTF